MNISYQHKCIVMKKEINVFDKTLIYIINTFFYHLFIIQCNTFNNQCLWFMVFNTTYSNISDISWRSVLLVEEIGVSEENH